MADVTVTNKKTGETEVLSGNQNKSKPKKSSSAPDENVENTEPKKMKPISHKSQLKKLNQFHWLTAYLVFMKVLLHQKMHQKNCPIG